MAIKLRGSGISSAHELKKFMSVPRAGSEWWYKWSKLWIKITEFSVGIVGS
jgi:hypothetical protein